MEKHKSPHHHGSDGHPGADPGIEIKHDIQHADPGALVRYCPRCAGPMVRQQIEGENRVHPACSSCGYIFFLNPKVVAASLPIQNGRVILLRRGIEPAYGRWTFPGGYVDLGEPVEEAAVREAREEIGVAIKLTRLLNLYSYHGAESVVAVYLAQVLNGEPRPGKEALECDSFDAQGVPWNDLAFRSTQDALRDWVRTGC